MPRRASSSRTDAWWAWSFSVSNGTSRRATRRSSTRVVIPCDDVILAIGQENAFPWIERDLGLEVGDWDMPVVDPVTFQSSLPGVFFGGDSAMGPKNIIWAVEHGHQAAISIHNHCEGIAVTARPPQGMNLVSQKMGLTEWSYHNDYNPSSRQRMQHVELTRPLPEHRHRGGGGILRGADRARSAALPQLRYPDGLRRPRSASSATRASTSARCSA